MGPTPIKPLTAEERILTIGATWGETTRTEGYVSDAEVAFIRADDRFAVHLTAHASTALVDIERTELIRTPQGREYHCKVRGAVQSIVKYAFRLDEPRVEIRIPSVALPRTCDQSGFSQPTRQFEALNATYALRGDRLLAIDPPTYRSSLLPSD